MKGRIAVSIVALVAIALLIGCGEEPEKPKEEKTALPATEKTAKVFTDDDFIEYWAQTVYLREKYGKNPIKLGGELIKLHEKYPGIAEKFPTWMTEWQQKAINDPIKVAKQWEEIRKRVENRTNELRKGK